jgi:hypothetical protein
MAEEPNQVEADRIKANIERTRDNMSGTIDEIQERLNPSNLVQQAKESMRDAAVDKLKGAVSTAKGAVETAGEAGMRAVTTAGEVGRRALSTATVQGKRALGTAGETARRAAGQARTSGTRAVSTARENPVSVALVASGVAWLVSRGVTARRHRSPSDSWSRRETAASGLIGSRQAQGAFVAGALGYYLLSRQMASSRSAAIDSEPLRRSVVGPARELGASAQRLGREAQRMAGEYAGRGKELGQHVTRWVGDNPLAVGAAVVALGTVVGLSLTSHDDDWMSDGGDEWTHASRRGAEGIRYDDDRAGGADADIDPFDDDLGPASGRGRSSRM